MTDWIDFVEQGPSASGKTRIWAVVPKDGSAGIGQIRWYAPWRKYCFHPCPNTVFEQDCLRKIAAFIETQTILHKSNARGAK